MGVLGRWWVSLLRKRPCDRSYFWKSHQHVQDDGGNDGGPTRDRIGLESLFSSPGDEMAWVDTQKERPEMQSDIQRGLDEAESGGDET